jgi:hypothetical protein
VTGPIMMDLGEASGTTVCWVPLRAPSCAPLDGFIRNDEVTNEGREFRAAKLLQR